MRTLRSRWPVAIFLLTALVLLEGPGGGTARAEEKKPKEKAGKKVKKSDPKKEKAKKMTTTASGLMYEDTALGTGDSPTQGKTVVVHYTGTFPDGKKFDSSRDRGKPFEFEIGMGQVIKGWDEGVMSMKVGGRRKLVVPPELGYGERRVGPIPPHSTLHFDVELLKIK
jgi:peptidylprolyl isomerase